MIDQYGRTIDYLRLSVTDLCNYRCQYCMPADGVEKGPHGAVLSVEEYGEIARAAVKVGIRKIRLTGGEPLVRRGILDICRTLRAIPELKELCLTTNGSLLPELAKSLQEAGVDRLNISLDTLRTERFREITRRGDLEDAFAGIRAAEDAGFQNLKLDTVLMGGVNDDEIEDFLSLTKEHPWEVAVHRTDAYGALCGMAKGTLPAGNGDSEPIPGAGRNRTQWRGPAVPSAGSHGDCGADHPHEPRVLWSVPPHPGDGGRQAEGLSPQPGGNLPPGTSRRGIGGCHPPGHPAKAQGAPPHGTCQRYAPDHE